MTNLRLLPPENLAEQIETLKFKVASYLNGNAPSKGVMIVFTSCMEGEGVSSIAANFAASVSQDDDKAVLLMDCNLGNPSLKNIFRKDGCLEKQITEPENDYSCGSIWKVIRPSGNLDVLLADKLSRSSHSVFQKSWFAEMIAQAQEQYDYIIIDAPPVGTDISAALLSAQAHGVVIVIQAEKVRREVIQRSISLLEDSGARVLGAVLNKRRFPIPSCVYKLL